MKTAYSGLSRDFPSVSTSTSFQTPTKLHPKLDLTYSNSRSNHAIKQGLSRQFPNIYPRLSTKHDSSLQYSAVLESHENSSQSKSTPSRTVASTLLNPETIGMPIIPRLAAAPSANEGPHPIHSGHNPSGHAPYHTPGKHGAANAPSSVSSPLSPASLGGNSPFSASNRGALGQLLSGHGSSSGSLEHGAATGTLSLASSSLTSGSSNQSTHSMDHVGLFIGRKNSQLPSNPVQEMSRDSELLRTPQQGPPHSHALVHSHNAAHSTPTTSSHTHKAIGTTTAVTNHTGGASSSPALLSTPLKLSDGHSSASAAIALSNGSTPSSLSRTSSHSNVTATTTSSLTSILTRASEHSDEGRKDRDARPPRSPTSPDMSSHPHLSPTIPLNFNLTKSPLLPGVQRTPGTLSQSSFHAMDYLSRSQAHARLSNPSNTSPPGLGVSPSNTLPNTFSSTTPTTLPSPLPSLTPDTLGAVKTFTGPTSLSIPTSSTAAAAAGHTPVDRAHHGSNDTASTPRASYASPSPFLPQSSHIQHSPKEGSHLHTHPPSNSMSLAALAPLTLDNTSNPSVATTPSSTSGTPTAIQKRQDLDAPLSLPPIAGVTQTSSDNHSSQHPQHHHTPQTQARTSGNAPVLAAPLTPVPLPTGTEDVISLSHKPITFVRGVAGVGAVSWRGRNPLQRKINQDAVIVAEHLPTASLLVAVMDGHGAFGREAATYIKDLYPVTLFNDPRFIQLGAPGSASASEGDFPHGGQRPVHSNSMQSTFSVATRTMSNAGDSVSSFRTFSNPGDSRSNGGNSNGADGPHSLHSLSYGASHGSTATFRTDSSLPSVNNPSIIVDLLVDALMKVEASLIEHSGINVTLSGTTAVIALIRDGTIHCINAGDSRAVVASSPSPMVPLSQDSLLAASAGASVSGSQGAAILALHQARGLPALNPAQVVSTPQGDISLSEAHAVVSRILNTPPFAHNGVRARELSLEHKPDVPKEKARILASGGRIAATRVRGGLNALGPLRVWLQNSPLPGLNMTRSLGDLIAKQAGVISVPHRSVSRIGINDRALILASDGLWDFVSAEEASVVALSSTNTHESCSRLVRLSRSRWLTRTAGADDTSVVIVQLSDPGHLDARQNPSLSTSIAASVAGRFGKRK